MNKELEKRFLTNTDESGRFIVHSQVTGKKYYVEPIGGLHSNWGDVNPATKKVEGSYGNKFKGSINESESLITKENGFEEITYSGIGTSPFSEIERRDREYEKTLTKNKQ